MYLKAQLKCIYNNGSSVENKQKLGNCIWWRIMILSLSQKHGRMTRMTRIPPLRAMSFVKVIDKVAGVGKLSSTIRRLCYSLQGASSEKESGTD